MSTRSFVGVMIGDKVRAVYVHYDGYLEGVGADLQEYRTQSEVEELISHGDRSSLDSGYYKDNEDEDPSDNEPFIYDDFEAFYKACDNSSGEWYYIFNDGVWYCGNTYGLGGDEPLYRKLVPYNEAVEIWKNHYAKND